MTAGRGRLETRGTRCNPENRFEQIRIDDGPEWRDDEAGSAEPTLYYRDASRSVLAENDSPDVGFRFSLNPYRGCEHGCIYCYARPTHEYLGLSAGLDFERRITVKEDAPLLLRQMLRSPRWQPQVVALSGNTDCYQPIERRLQLTRRCLEVFCEFRNPVGVTTKSALVVRDIDLLGTLAAFGAANVMVSLTTLDGDLARRMEPRAAAPERRLETINALSRAHIPVGVMIAPVIPGLNDHEIPSILQRAAAAGARSASWLLLRLPAPVDQLLIDWLRDQLPEQRQRVLNRIRQCRSGALSDSHFGRRMRGEGAYAEQIAALFHATARRSGLDQPLLPLNTRAFRHPPRSGEQLSWY